MAEQLFLKYGLRSVSIDDICNELHISKKTFYNNKSFQIVKFKYNKNMLINNSQFKTKIKKKSVTLQRTTKLIHS